MRADPFTGYSLILRTIVYGIVPLFTLWQVVRLRRGLHVFQLEGYKRARFLSWCRQNATRALFLSPGTAKKPLAMTGRAWRILIVATVLTVVVLLGPAGAVHLAAGAPGDLVTWGISAVVAFLGVPLLLVAADLILVPVQTIINSTYERAARQKLADIAPTVIGVTGSFGKTSAKMAIATLIGSPREIFATPASYNTPMGVCRAINEGLEGGHRFFVVEMGAYREGDIAELCRIVSPRIGVLTAIGPAHLERFGSLDAIRRAKYELIASLPSDGVAVMNVDDAEVRALADATSHVRVVRYGLDSAGRPDYTAEEITVTPDGTDFALNETSTGKQVRGRTRLLGRHAVGHVLAAVAVARSLDRELGPLMEQIGVLEAPDHRLKIVPGTAGITVIDDAYNSNPEGAAAALEVLSNLSGNKKVVVTPGIIELGPLQREANEEFGAKAAGVADAIVVVAKVNRDALVHGARRANSGVDVIVVDSLEQATERLQTLLSPGDVVLFENDLPDQYEN